MLVQLADQRRVEQGHGPSHLPLRCQAGDACYSGLCPVCMRQARYRVLRLGYERQMHKSDWLFVTVFIGGRTAPPGDHKRLSWDIDLDVTRLRKGVHGACVFNVLVIGAFETVYKTVANQPVGKPFHLHLLVRGLTAEQIHRILCWHLSLDTSVPRSVVIQKVGASEIEFLNTLSYVLKQPFWKSSKADVSALERRIQWPKPNELAELISNLGPHNPYGRLFSISTSPIVRFRPKRFWDATGIGKHNGILR